MNLLQLAAQYPAITCGLVGMAGVAYFFPVQALLVLRWLVGTELGRYLCVAALVVVAFIWFRADAFADGRAFERGKHEKAARALALQQLDRELRHTRLSHKATERARASSDDRATNLNRGLKQAEGIAREPRAPVPAVCPEPDARLLQHLQERRQSAEALGGELRALRGAEARPAQRAR